MFDEQKVSQMAAHFLNLRGGAMSYLKLMKLLYLSDRKAMDVWGESMSGDCFVSMKHGPVLSQTYELITGMAFPDDTAWNEWIESKANYEVSLRKKDLQRQHLDELSNSEIAVLDDIFKEFGHYRRFDLADYTHEHCKEWQDPHGSSFPIKPETIFRALGKTEVEIDALLQHNTSQQYLSQITNLLV